jgi:hypothetical protein
VDGREGAFDVVARLTVALLHLSAAPARAEVVPTHQPDLVEQSSFLGAEQGAHVRRGQSPVHELEHEPHRPVDVMEELLEAGTQGVQTRIAIGCADESILDRDVTARS